MAAAILFAGMLAVMAAIMAGQQNVFEAELQLQASLLAEERMQDIVQLSYNSMGPPAVEADQEFDWNGGTVHQMINIEVKSKAVPNLGVEIEGKEIAITIFFALDPISPNWRTVAELKAFVPKPA